MVDGWDGMGWDGWMNEWMLRRYLSCKQKYQLDFHFFILFSYFLWILFFFRLFFLVNELLHVYWHTYINTSYTKRIKMCGCVCVSVFANRTLNASQQGRIYYYCRMAYEVTVCLQLNNTTGSFFPSKPHFYCKYKRPGG